MIVCKKCGHQNEDDDQFCGSCGTFLEWVGEKLVEAQPEPPPPVEVEPEPPKPKGIVERVKDAILVDKDEDPSPVVEPASKESAAPTVDVEPGAEEAGTPSVTPSEPVKAVNLDDGASSEGPDDAEARARALAAKLPPPQPAPASEKSPIVPKPSPPIGVRRGMAKAESVPEDDPHAIKPAPPKPRPTPKPPAPAPRPIQPGDLICGHCGAGNDATRRFCRQCGASLAEAAPAVRLPWWKRLFRRRKRKHLAGERPWRARAGDAGRTAMTARRRVLGMVGSVKRLLMILALLGISVSFIGPWRSSVTDWIGNRLDPVRRLIAPRLEIVHAVKAQGSTEGKGHPAGHAIDDIRQTYWSESVRGPGNGEYLVIFFSTPTDIDRIDFLIGALDKPERFLEEPRPKDVRVVFTDATVLEANLKDVDTFQPFNVKARGVRSVQIIVRSVFPGTKGSALSIAEVKFYVKR